MRAANSVSEQHTGLSGLALTLRFATRRGVLSLTRLGWGLAVPVFFLALIGLAMIHATDATAAKTVDLRSDDVTPAANVNWLRSAYAAIGPLTFKQGIFILGGVGVMLLILWPSYQKIGRYAYLIYWAVIGLLLVLVIDRFVFDIPDVLVPELRNARRWIQFGLFSIQPSEFMKPALILVLARYLRFRKSYRRWRGLFVPFLLTMLPMVLILFQPDLGTLLMLLPVLFAMLFAAGARMRHLLTIVLLGTATLPFFYYYGMAEYQQMRVQVLFRQNTDNERWHMGPGYQLRQSKIALGTGGVFGEGYGQGPFVRHDLLPDEHNDFIYAIVGHQWGIVGCVLVLIAYAVIVLCGVEVATVTNDPFGRLLAVGVIVMIVAQALLNISMTIGLAPITGMTLPFVSYGGSSLWANFIGLGLLVNVAQRRPMLIAHRPFEHHDD